jgi:ABC-type amino acid transport substrate-binding protein
MVSPVCRLGRRAILAALLAVVGAPATAETITIHTEAWENYTAKDGTGFAWETIRAVYNPVGIELDFKIVPYARAVDNVTHGNADAWVASYRNETPKAVYPDWHYDADRVGALYVPDRVAAPEDANDLAGRRVAWVRGYKMQKYIDVPMTVDRINKQETAINMLVHGRVDYFLESLQVIRNLLDDLPGELDRDRFAYSHVTNLPLYLGFAPTAKGRRFARIWDRRFPKLLANGTIAELYETYGWKVWPFDVPREAGAADAIR